MNDNPELAMTALVIIIMVLIFAMVWFVFLVPMEKGLHQRRMKLIQKRLQKNEERLKHKDGGTQDGRAESRDIDNASKG